MLKNFIATTNSYHLTSYFCFFCIRKKFDFYAIPDDLLFINVENSATLSCSKATLLAHLLLFLFLKDKSDAGNNCKKATVWNFWKFSIKFHTLWIVNYSVARNNTNTISFIGIGVDLNSKKLFRMILGIVSSQVLSSHYFNFVMQKICSGPYKLRCSLKSHLFYI